MKYSLFFSEVSRGLALRSFAGIVDRSTIKRSFEASSFKDAVNKAEEIWKEIEDNPRIPVIIIEHLEEPYFTSMNNSLYEMQRIVQGNIDIVNCPDLKDIDIICNDEGKLFRLPLNRSLTSDDQVYDVIAGNMILAASDEEGNTIGLSKEQIIRSYKFFQEPEIFVVNDIKEEIEVLNCTLEMARIMKMNFIPNVSLNN